MQREHWADEETSIQLGEGGWAEGYARKIDHTGKPVARSQWLSHPFFPLEIKGVACLVLLLGVGGCSRKRNPALKSVFNGQARPELGNKSCVNAMVPGLGTVPSMRPTSQNRPRDWIPPGAQCPPPHFQLLLGLLTRKGRASLTLTIQVNTRNMVLTFHPLETCLCLWKSCPAEASSGGTRIREKLAGYGHSSEWAPGSLHLFQM